MLKKLSIVILSLGLITGCQSKYKEGDNYNTVKSEKEANKRNKEKYEEASNKVYFGFDEYFLTKDAKKVLKLQADSLKKDESIDIIVEGHCDERGTKEYNYALGARRANVVKEYLIKKNVDSKRIKTVSYGKDRPEFLGRGEAVWSKNRRAVILIND